jgi:hypothetical protein
MRQRLANKMSLITCAVQSVGFEVARVIVAVGVKSSRSKFERRRSTMFNDPGMQYDRAAASIPLWARLAGSIRVGLAFVLVLSGLGCSDSSSPDPTEATTGPPSDLRCSQATTHGPDQTEVAASSEYGCWYPAGFQGISPSVQVTRDGVLVVAREKGGVLISEDEGRHWSEVAVPAATNGDNHVDGIHGYVHVDERTDRIHYVTSLFKASCGGFSGALVSWSDDVGQTWMGSTAACDTYDWGKVLTGPSPPGSAYPSALYFFGVGVRPVGGQRFVYRSLDGGETWQRMENIASATTEAGVGVAAPDGTIYFDYPEFTGFDPSRFDNTTYPYVPENQCRQMVAVSEDFGETWRQEPVPGSLACGQLYGQQRVAVDRDGTVYVVWVDDTDTRLYLSTSTDQARTWSDPIDIMAPGMTFSLTHANIVAAEAGHVLIASLQTQVPDRPPSPPGYPGLYGGDYAVHAILTESRDATALQPRFTSVDLDAGGDPTLDAGEAPNEANAYLGMSSTGQGWAVFIRHSKTYMSPGDIAVARFFPID